MLCLSEEPWQQGEPAAKEEAKAYHRQEDQDSCRHMEDCLNLLPAR